MLEKPQTGDSRQSPSPDLAAAAEIAFSIDTAEMESFRRLSGDDNPLHFDPAFARARGFDGPVVYGGLLIAKVSRLLGSEIPGHGCVWQSLRLGFRAPLYVGAPAVLRGEIRHRNDELGIWKIGLRLTAGDSLVAEGDAQALRRDGVPAGTPQ